MATPQHKKINNYTMDLLNTTETANQLLQLIKDHENISFAVAWAGQTKVFEALQASKDKIRNSVIGTNSCNTAQRVLEWSLEENPRLEIKFWYDTSSRPIFHPKIYVFWSKGGRWDVLIGSANLTNGGMVLNTELMLHVSGKDGIEDDFFNNTKKTIAKYWRGEKSVYITQDLLDKYSAKKQEQNRRKIEMEIPALPNYKGPDVLQMDWTTFYKTIRLNSIGEKSVEQRLRLLSIAQEKFESVESFRDLDEADQKALAATVSIGKGDFKEIDIGWFGRTGSGRFIQLISNNNVHVSRALDHIPLDGQVYKDQYMNYISEFLKAFRQFDGEFHALATLTRLITIKRPDVFVSWNNASKQTLNKALRLRPNLEIHDYEGYWDRVIELIRDYALWYDTAQPKRAQEEKIWKCRVAMLDVLCYSPPKD